MSHAAYEEQDVPLFELDEQPELPDPGEWREPLHHRTGPETELNEVPNAGTMRRLVLTALAEEPLGYTDFELAEILHMHRAAARRNELLNSGWVMDSGHRRPSGLGGTAVVWVLTNAGRAELGLAS